MALEILEVNDGLVKVCGCSKWSQVLRSGANVAPARSSRATGAVSASISIVFG